MAAADSLRMRAEALGRMRTWLTIATPPDDGQFPYRLVVVDSAAGRPVTSDSIAAGTVIQLRLDADTARLAAAATRQPRFVYVFNIDSKGKATLLFPADGTNASNRVPYFMGNKRSVARCHPRHRWQLAGSPGSAPPTLALSRCCW